MYYVDHWNKKGEETANLWIVLSDNYAKQQRKQNYDNPLNLFLQENNDGYVIGASVSPEGKRGLTSWTIEVFIEDDNFDIQRLLEPLKNCGAKRRTCICFASDGIGQLGV